MLKQKYEEILERYKTYYSFFYNQTVDWWPSGRLCITVKLEDGALLEYDSVDNTIRKIQLDRHMTDSDFLRKEIGHNLQKVISARGMSQGDIAAKCGITDAMLSRYIHGTSMPGVDKIYALADVLGCRITDILDEQYRD